MKQASENILGENLEVLSCVTLEIFDKQKAHYLSVFYWCRIQKDLKKKIFLPNKGTLAKVTDGELDRKTNSQLLIKLCYDIKLLPVIVTIPEAHNVEVPTISIVTPAVIDLSSGNDTIAIDRAKGNYIIKSKHTL